MRTRRAPTLFSSVGMISVVSCRNRPTTMRADDRAPDRAEATERDGGEDEQQELEAHLERHLLGEAEQDAAQSRERRSDDPHDRDDALDVDSGAGGERRVVGDCPGGLAHAGSSARATTTTARAIRATTADAMSVGVIETGPNSQPGEAGELGVGRLSPP